MEKYCIAGQVTDNHNTALAHCMLYTEGYKCTRYVRHIAYPLQHCLHEHASLLRYMRIFSLVLKYGRLYESVRIGSAAVRILNINPKWWSSAMFGFLDFRGKSSQ